MRTIAVALALLVGQALADEGSATAADELPALPTEATGPVITLKDALRAAGERNLDLRMLSAQLDEAQESTWKALSWYLPQVSLGASYTRQDEGKLPLAVPAGPPTGIGPRGEPIFSSFAVAEAEFQKAHLYAAQLSATQTLVSARLYYSIRGAKESQKALGLGLENGRRQVLFGVARAYFGAAALKEGVGVSQRLLEAARRQEHDASARYQAGAVARVNLLRTQIDRARAEEDLKQARAAYLSAKVGLAALLVRDTAFEVEGPPEPSLPSEDLEELVNQGIKARPDVQSFRAEERAEEENTRAVKSRYLPEVQLFGTYQWANQLAWNGRHDTWWGGVRLEWTLFDGLRRESDIRQGEARIAEAKARSEGALVRVREEVSRALLDLESQRANAQKSREQRELARENARLVDVAYRAGKATAVEQADATAQLRNSEAQVIADQLNAQLAALSVLNTVGAFHPGEQ
ncbi:MAG TPA: TolC family protein [Anaeromyxobacter sp.]|nr:TolC family protein [Anaeromyxobacter sp.]